ncbi:MAG: hypothetical protein PHF00_09285 [Elusimicrobia bacterium]|nr:hypothetical protein [Elusimicrobiota bacterium]
MSLWPFAVAIAAALPWGLARPAFCAPQATTLDGKPVAERKADPDAKGKTQTITIKDAGGKTITMDCHLPPNFLYTVKEGGQRWLDCLYDCGDVIAEGWDIDTCYKLPDCLAKLQDFQKAAEKEKAKSAEDKQADAQKGADDQARRFLESMTAAEQGWDTCRDPKTGDAMKCAEFLAKYGEPSGKSPDPAGGKAFSPLGFGPKPEAGAGKKPGRPDAGGTTASGPSGTGAPEGKIADPGTGIVGAPAKFEEAVPRTTLDEITHYAIDQTLLAKVQAPSSVNFKPLRDPAYINTVSQEINRAVKTDKTGEYFDGPAHKDKLRPTQDNDYFLIRKGAAPDPNKEL